jgi:O-antigen/teichoic acid export membrane protein
MQGFVGKVWGQVKSPLYRNAFFIMLSSVIGSGLGFFYWLVVARLYVKEDVGYAVTLFQTISFLATLGLLGLGTALVRYLPETDEKEPLVNTSLTIVGILCLLLSVAFIAGVTIWAPDLSFILQNPIYPVAILLTTLMVGFAPILDQTGFAMRRADVLTWRTLAFAILKIPLAVLFAIFAITGGRFGIFMALALAFGISILLEGLWLVPRILPGYRPRPHLGFSRLRPMIHFSLGNYAAGVIGAAGSLLLPLMILDVLGAAGAANAAYFYIATVVAGLLYIIPNATFTSFYAEASQRNANRHVDERRAILLSLALLAPAIAVLWFFAQPMLVLFGDPAYAAGAVGALHILVFASIPVFLNSILSTRVRVRKKTMPLIIGAAIGTLVTLIAGFFLLRTQGIDGLSIAYVIGNAAPTPYYYLVARKSFATEPIEPIEPSPAQL